MTCSRLGTRAGLTARLSRLTRARPKRLAASVYTRTAATKNMPRTAMSATRRTRSDCMSEDDATGVMADWTRATCWGTADRAGATSIAAVVDVAAGDVVNCTRASDAPKLTAGIAAMTTRAAYHAA